MPRYLEQTADQVAALGDVKYMIVTARDNADGKTRLKQLVPGKTSLLYVGGITAVCCSESEMSRYNTQIVLAV